MCFKCKFNKRLGSVEKCRVMEVDTHTGLLKTTKIRGTYASEMGHWVKRVLDV